MSSKGIFKCLGITVGAVIATTLGSGAGAAEHRPMSSLSGSTKLMVAARDSHTMGPRQFDADGDGKVTLAEFQAGGAKMFKMIDADGDGRISLEEFNTHRAGMFRMMDANGDGVLSGGELPSPGMGMRHSH
jgi:hypothetical protein